MVGWVKDHLSGMWSSSKARQLPGYAVLFSSNYDVNKDQINIHVKRCEDANQDAFASFAQL